MTQQKIVEYWLSKAKNELRSANIMFDNEDYLYTGFMCHQCIEKALKAYYVHVKNERQPYDHRLHELSSSSGLSNLMDECHKSIIEKLDPLYLKARYDDYKNKISSLLTKNYCQSLLNETEELLTWIIKMME